MIAPGWGTNWAYLRTTDAPPVVTPLVVGTYSPTNLNAYWAYGYNWLARIGAGTNLQLQLAGDWQQSSSSFSEEAPHYIWIVNDGPYSESLSFSPSSNWVFMPTFSVPISPFSLATNQILKLTIDHLTPGFQNTPFTVTGVTVTNPAALLY
jgi:hypothetical protein